MGASSSKKIKINPIHFLKDEEYENLNSSISIDITNKK